MKWKKENNSSASLISVGILSSASLTARGEDSARIFLLWRLSLLPRLHVRLVNVDVRPEPGSGLCHVPLHHSVQQKRREKERGWRGTKYRPVKAIPARLQRPTLVSHPSRSSTTSLFAFSCSLSSSSSPSCTILVVVFVLVARTWTRASPLLR